MDLFSMNREKTLERKAPLADRMRPESLGDFKGQGHILDPGMPLYRLIQADKVRSMILFGPPGTGKTTLAQIISKTTNSEFEELSAVSAGIKDIREMVDKAEEVLGMYGRSTILFIDEIHRFNKTQQDALLPHVESGLITLIGATTENPFFSVNKALLSRSQVVEMKALSSEDLNEILDRALSQDQDIKRLDIDLSPEARDYLIKAANGDARVILNSLEIAALSTDPPAGGGKILISREDIENSIQKKVTKYDPDGDEHYNTVSAFIKSIRGSDPDATLYYLARMLAGGEDPRFVARRLIISASEDIGLANSNALTVAVSAFEAINHVGMPEGRIPLAHAAVYLALSPKSNTAYLGINQAMDFVQKSEHSPVPDHLKDSHYSGSEFFGAGEGYLYPHSYENAYVEQDYLPENVLGQVFYRGKDIGGEKNLLDWNKHICNENIERSE